MNAIEMVWIYIKRKVASRNSSFTSSHAEQETEKYFKDIAVQDIAKYVRHTQKEEGKFRNISVVVDS